MTPLNMKNWTVIRFVSLVLLFFTFSIHAQVEEDEGTDRQPIPPSPTAASLGKYGNTPVNAASGLPSISIPLLEVKGTQMSVSISLSYFGGGQKVTDVASWVGLGWSLNAGGIITRTVIGNEDRSATGIRQFYNGGFDPATFNPEIDAGDSIRLYNIARNGWTADPDIYSFNFMGYSGQFYIDLDDNIRLFSYQDLDFEIVSGIGQIDKFIVRDGNGTTFEFAAIEVTDKSYSSTCSTFESQDIFNSAWHLTKITTLNDEFTFTYTDETIQYEINKESSETKSMTGFENNDCGGPTYCESFHLLSIATKRLTSISGPFGIADFFANKSRTNYDLHGSNALETISYLDKEVVLNTAFSTTNRLKLNSVAILSSSQPENYQFSYSGTDLPQPGSNKRDHWDYYNGKSNIGGPKPAIGTDWPTGADREADPLYTHAGNLASVTYPTGGHTVYEWENSSQLVAGSPATNTVPGTASISEPNTVQALQVLSTTFTINAAQAVQISYDIGQNAGSSEQGELDLSGIPGVSGNFTATGTIASSILQPGTYTLTATNNGISFDNLLITIPHFNEVVIPGQEEVILLGGLRVKSIKNYNGPQLLTQKHYEYPETSVSNLILPQHYMSTVEYCYAAGDPFPIVLGSCTQITRSSSSKFAVASRPSYSRVLEYEAADKAVNGYTEYLYYTNPNNGGGTLGTPLNDVSWKRGLLKERRVYDKDDVMLTQEVNNYTFELRHKLEGLRAGFTQSCQQFPGEEVITYRFYFRSSEWARLNSVTSTEFRSNGNTQQVVTYNYYRPSEHVMANEVTTTNSRGEQVKTVTHYPRDYSDTDLVFSALKEEYWSKPIANVQQNLTKNVILGASINDYDEFGLLQNQWKAFFETPLSGSSWTYSNGLSDPTISGIFGINVFYGNDPEVSIDYYPDHRLREVRSRSGTKTYLWGYNSNYLVAMVDNATYQEVIANIPETDINNLKTDLDSRHIANQLLVFDGLLPAGVFMTKYLYREGIGVSKMIDVNNRTTSYNYDDHGKLVEVRDHDGHLIKEYVYNWSN